MILIKTLFLEVIMRFTLLCILQELRFMPRLIFKSINLNSPILIGLQ